MLHDRTGIGNRTGTLVGRGDDGKEPLILRDGIARRRPSLDLIVYSST
jgi:hypothetical protein